MAGEFANRLRRGTQGFAEYKRNAARHAAARGRIVRYMPSQFDRRIEKLSTRVVNSPMYIGGWKLIRTEIHHESQRSIGS